jgi:P-type conjugative transfer protein TrbJ
MPHHHSILNSLCVLAGTVAVMASGSTHPAQAGGAVTGATEITQILNNGELVALVGQSGKQIENQLTEITQLAEQIEHQLNIYKNLTQNTAKLGDRNWGKVMGDLDRLRGIVNQGRSVSFSLGNFDDVLKQRFKSYSELKSKLPHAESFSTTYQGWSETNRDTIASTLRAASLTADQFEGEEATMDKLRSMSETADGQMKALEIGHQIAAQQVAQMQKLRGLASQQMTMMGTWLQSEQTEKDLAQARREKFFNADVGMIRKGQTMEPRW